MNSTSKTVHEIVQNPWVNFIATLATIASFGWLLYDKISVTPEQQRFAPLVIFSAALVIFVAVNLYSFKIRRLMRDYLRIPSHLHRINHLYRDSLSNICGGHGNPLKKDEVLQDKTTTLTKVCDHIAEIFERFISKECQVTVKLLGKDSDGLFCETYTRNGGKNERDQAPPGKFRVLTGENTAFDTALMVTMGNKPSHYWSPDLSKEKHYKNQRQGYLDFYKSVIVVPIRYAIPTKKGCRDGTDDIGFLCVD